MRGNLGSDIYVAGFPPQSNHRNHPLIENAECLTCFETVHESTFPARPPAAARSHGDEPRPARTIPKPQPAGRSTLRRLPSTMYAASAASIRRCPPETTVPHSKKLLESPKLRSACSAAPFQARSMFPW